MSSKIILLVRDVVRELNTKIYVRRNANQEVVIGMSTSKSQALQKLKARNFACITHVVKWYIYRENINQNHWIKEIASYLAYASNIELKGRRKTLSTSDIMNSLLHSIGDGDHSDARNILQEFIWDVARPEGYPEFLISEELVSQFSLFLKEFKCVVVPVIKEKNPHELEEFYPLLDECYSKYRRPASIEFKHIK